MEQTAFDLGKRLAVQTDKDWGDLVAALVVYRHPAVITVLVEHGLAGSAVTRRANYPTVLVVARSPASITVGRNNWFAIRRRRFEESVAALVVFSHPSLFTVPAEYGLAGGAEVRRASHLTALVVPRPRFRPQEVSGHGQVLAESEHLARPIQTDNKIVPLTSAVSVISSNTIEQWRPSYDYCW